MVKIGSCFPQENLLEAISDARDVKRSLGERPSVRPQLTAKTRVLPQAVRGLYRSVENESTQVRSNLSLNDMASQEFDRVFL